MARRRARFLTRRRSRDRRYSSPEADGRGEHVLLAELSTPWFAMSLDRIRWRSWMHRGLAALTAIVLAAATSPIQQQGPARGHYSAPIPYDGRLTFVRLRWGADLPSSTGRRGFRSAWIHDYPRAEQHLSAII